jgi:hypothetical protein
MRRHLTALYVTLAAAAAFVLAVGAILPNMHYE